MKLQLRNESILVTYIYIYTSVHYFNFKMLKWKNNTLITFWYVKNTILKQVIMTLVVFSCLEPIINVAKILLVNNKVIL